MYAAVTIVTAALPMYPAVCRFATILLTNDAPNSGDATRALADPNDPTGYPLIPNATLYSAPVTAAELRLSPDTVYKPPSCADSTGSSRDALLPTSTVPSCDTHAFKNCASATGCDVNASGTTTLDPVLL